MYRNIHMVFFTTIMIVNNLDLQTSSVHSNNIYELLITKKQLQFRNLHIYHKTNCELV